MIMTYSKKQLKINYLFRKKGVPVPEDCEDLEQEIQELEQKLREKENELFLIQRSIYRHKTPQLRHPPDTFMRPQKIVLNNSIQSLKNSLESMAMLSGMEVQSYVAGEHCSIVYHMQYPSQYSVKHGLKINMQTDDNEVLKCSLPLGFNYKAVIEEFDNIKTPDCLGNIRKALVAYYDRLEQFEELKTLVNIQAKLFKTMDGSHMEISFAALSDMEDDEHIQIVLILDYRVYDIRPKNYSFKEIDLPDREALREQCKVFKRKPLHKAFKTAFIDGEGPYKMVQHYTPRPASSARRPPKRFKPNKYNYNNDDTFLPEDCSEHSDEDDAV